MSTISPLANPYSGYFPQVVLPDLRKLDEQIKRCDGCAGWTYGGTCRTCEVPRG